MNRIVVLFARPSAAAAAPPGVDPGAFARAVVEDAYEAVSALSAVTVAVAVPEPDGGGQEWNAGVRSLLWPDTRLLEMADPSRLLDGGSPVGRSGDAIALVVADAPDLPDLVVASVFSALDTAAVAVSPALRGGLTVLGWRQPAPAWLRTVGAVLDAPDAVERLHGVADPGSLAVTRPWRRLRSPADLASLDVGLEGWEATRALLAGGSSAR